MAKIVEKSAEDREVIITEVFPAHILIDKRKSEHIQTVGEHCCNVARYTRETLMPLGLPSTGELAGLIHDAGKFCRAFSEYIYHAVRGEPVRRGSVNHTFAGVRLLLERYFDPAGDPYHNMTCEILAFAVGSHHGQFDCIDPDGKDGFLHRLEKEGISYPESKENFLFLCADTQKLDKLFEQSVEEIKQAVAACKTAAKSTEELLFVLSLLSRSVLSALIDADRQDTAEFMHAMDFPQPPRDMRPVWQKSLMRVEKKLLEFGNEKPIDQARRVISDQCRAFAKREGGVYRLWVPTGSGKTLAGLRAALAFAAGHDSTRLFFVIPLLGVLEQNAKVIREYLQDDSLILEHHSNVLRIKNDRDELDENELLCENWRSPVVITTLVQFLNTLFDGGTSSIRRMNALAGSVIILDEVQSVPRRMLSLFNLALNFLSKVCGATVILCSATQPCLEEVRHPVSLAANPDLVPYDPALWQPFLRTEIIDRCKPDGYTVGELADFALEELDRFGSVLIICNKKEQARALYQELHTADAKVFHLSTAMCMAHRIDTMKQINALLSDKARVICVATQLVEAGVDFSFGCVMRACAGMDNIIQAAGRCNRHGEVGCICPVYIINFQGEKLGFLREIGESQTATAELLSSFAKDWEAFDGSLQSERSIRYYYRRLFDAMPRQAQDYSVSELGSSLYEMLSHNSVFRAKGQNAVFHTICQAFRSAGDSFQVFDQENTDVLVPYGEGKTLIEELGSERARYDLYYRKELLEQSKPYCAALFQYQLRQLEEGHGLEPLCGDAILSVLPEFYNTHTGIDFSGGNQSFWEA